MEIFPTLATLHAFNHVVNLISLKLLITTSTFCIQGSDFFMI